MISTVSPVPRAGLPTRFWVMTCAIVISNLGDGMAYAAFPLLAEKSVGDSALLVAGVFAAGQLPNLAAIHVGALVDRLELRRVVRVVEFFRATLLLGFALLVARDGTPWIGLIAGVVLLLGIGQVFTDTAAHVALPSMVPVGQLGRANGTLFSAQYGAEQMAGPAIGGILFAAAASMPFLFDGLSFAFVALVLPLAIPRRAPRPATGGVVTSIRGEVREGVSFFRSDPLLQMLAAVVVFFAFCQAMVFSTLVLLAKGPLGLGSWGFGLLIAAASVGNVLGGLVGGRIERRRRADTVLIGAGVTVALAYMLAAATDDYLVVGIALFVEAVCVAAANVANVTARQRIIPSHLLGRTLGVFRLLICGVIPLGAVAGGLLAEFGTPRTPLLAAGGLQLLAISTIGIKLTKAVGADSRLAL